MGTRPLAHGSGENSTLGDDSAPPITKQRLLVTLDPGSLLLLLPDPIQPFKSSSYIQSQRFVLPPDDTNPASILVLDWYTSGRNAGKKFQEEWEFELYSSMNEVVYAARRADEQELDGSQRTASDASGTVEPSTVPIMREKVTLRARDHATPPPATQHPTLPLNLQSRMRPYQIYATLLIHGPLLQPLLTSLSTRANAPSETQFQASRPAPVVWSFSKIPKTQTGLGRGAVASDAGGIVRVAGVETEVVKRWVGEVLVQGKVKELVGDVLWQRIF
jgi:urease accessory protein